MKESFTVGIHVEIAEYSRIIRSRPLGKHDTHGGQSIISQVDGIDNSYLHGYMLSACQNGSKGKERLWIQSEFKVLKATIAMAVCIGEANDHVYGHR